MKSTRRLTGVMVVGCLGVFGSFAFGCGDDDRPGGMDAGPTTDSGGGVDGSVPDAHVELDAPWSMDGSIDGGSTADTGPGVDGGMPSELVRTLFCEPLARAMCAAPWDCACPEWGPRPDEATCVADTVAECVVSFATSEVGIAAAAGRAVVDTEALERCGRRAEASYRACSGTASDVNAWCARAFADVAPLGTFCTIGSPYCAGGAGSCLSETCAPVPGAGEWCDEYFPVCAAGLVCIDEACSDPRAAGEACGYDSHCVDDLFCVGGVCASAFAALGEACAADGDCASGAVCTASTCTMPASAPSCDEASDCPSLGTCELLYESRCAVRVPVGSACNSHEECTADALCDYTINTCVTRPAAGEACPWSACADGLTCFSDGYCRPLGNPGDPCVTFFGESDGCNEGLACVLGYCTSPPGDGASCADDGECADGLDCQIGPAGDPVCFPSRNAGEMCTGGWDGNDCYDGLFCDYRTGTCAASLGAGESCSGASGECADGLDCIYDDASRVSTCLPLPSIGELCGAVCADPGVCVFGPAGGACSPRVCRELPGFGGEPVPEPRPIDPPPPPPR